ncbi:MAG: GNAT family N-acetyltransferase [Gammaproteobacteria bacterium]|nr:GNAT family N-acetyltransferase [Gammaproteobacteria bacterium]
MITWAIKKFENLSLNELYAIWNLRESVFIMEQHCFYLDADGKDLTADHVLGYVGDRLAAYSRILYPSKPNEPIHFGRVCTHPEHRNSGLGKELIKRTMQFIKDHTDAQIIEISAQSYLLKFYQGFGFSVISDAYLDANIEHNDMRALIERDIA